MESFIQSIWMESRLSAIFLVTVMESFIQSTWMESWLSAKNITVNKTTSGLIELSFKAVRWEESPTHENKCSHISINAWITRTRAFFKAFPNQFEGTIRHPMSCPQNQPLIFLHFGLLASCLLVGQVETWHTATSTGLPPGHWHQSQHLHHCLPLSTALQRPPGGSRVWNLTWGLWQSRERKLEAPPLANITVGYLGPVVLFVSKLSRCLSQTRLFPLLTFTSLSTQAPCIPLYSHLFPSSPSKQLFTE